MKQPTLRARRSFSSAANVACAPLALVALALAALSQGCASTAPEAHAPLSAEEGFDASVEVLADAIVRAAEQRVDTNALRVYVDELREARDVREGKVRIYTGGEELATVGRELQRELIVALTSRLNLIDVDLARRTSGLPEDAPVDEIARAVGATHALVGTFSPRRDELEILVRLVDADNLVIVAAVSGVLSIEDLSDLGRLALAPPDVRPIRIIDVPRREPVVALELPVREDPVRADPVNKTESVSEVSVEEPGVDRASVSGSPDDAPVLSEVPAEVEQGPGQRKALKRESAGELPKVPIDAPPGPAQLRLRATGRSLLQPRRKAPVESTRAVRDAG
jgi:hypothetical protein